MDKEAIGVKSSDVHFEMCREGLQQEFLRQLEEKLLAHHDRLVQSLQPRLEGRGGGVCYPSEGAVGCISSNVDNASTACATPRSTGRSVAFREDLEDRQRGEVTEEEVLRSDSDERIQHMEPIFSDIAERTSTFSKAEAIKRFATLHTRPPTLSSMQSASTGSLSAHPLQTARILVKRLVSSEWFDVIMSGVILTNVIFSGIEVEYLAWARERDPPLAFYCISLSFTILFTLEILLRFSAYGLSFFYGSSWKWNLFDSLIVSVSLLEACVDLGRGGGRAVPSIRVVRMARLIRVLRIVRIMRHVRSLRILIYSVLNTLRSLVWTLVLLSLILYVFGLLFTQATTEFLLDPEHVHITNLEVAYGTLGSSIFTLFKSISGGVSWEETIRPLRQVHPMLMACFLLYFTFTYFAVLNVVTGVFCQTAIESAGHDQEMMAQAQMASKQFYVTQLENLFKKINVNNTGVITLKEFEQCYADEQLRAYFGSIDLTIDEAYSLFKLLDREEKHVLTIDAFVTGCLKLRGHAKTVDIAIMMYETRWSLQRCLKIVQKLHDGMYSTKSGTFKESEFSKHSRVFDPRSMPSMSL